MLYNIELFPEWDNHYYVLGQVRRLAGNIEGAREALEKAVELAPDNGFYRGALEQLDQQ